MTAWRAITSIVIGTLLHLGGCKVNRCPGQREQQDLSVTDMSRGAGSLNRYEEEWQKQFFTLS